MLAQLPPNPVLVGASLGGFTSMLLAGELSPGIASAVVLVDIVPSMNPSGAARIHDFMADRMVEGFASLDEVADMIAEYNPHRPRPTRSEWLARQPSSSRRSVVLALGSAVHRRHRRQSADRGDRPGPHAQGDRGDPRRRRPDAPGARPGERPRQRGPCRGVPRALSPGRVRRRAGCRSTWWPAIATICSPRPSSTSSTGTPRRDHSLRSAHARSQDLDHRSKRAGRRPHRQGAGGRQRGVGYRPLHRLGGAAATGRPRGSGAEPIDMNAEPAVRASSAGSDE